MPQVHLISHHATQDLPDLLRGLIPMAEAGDLSGMVFGLAFKGQKFYFESAGTLHRNPMMAIAVAAKLAAEMTRRIDRDEVDTIM